MSADEPGAEHGDAAGTVRARNAARRRAELAELERPRWTDRSIDAALTALVGGAVAVFVGLMASIDRGRNDVWKDPDKLRAATEYWTVLLPLFVLACALVGLLAGHRSADIWGVLSGRASDDERAAAMPWFLLLFAIAMAIVVRVWWVWRHP